MDVDIRAYLASKGLAVKPAGATNVHVSCPFCDEDPNKRGRLYVNVDPDSEPPALFYCFAGETEVLTWNGVRPIRELAGTTQRLLTSHGRWVDAPVKSFGLQPLMKVLLSRNGLTKAIHATPEHRWLLRRTGKARRVVTTESLKPQDRLAFSYPQRLAVKGIRPSPFGIAHGIVFGDGTRSYKGSVVDLHGDKNAQLLKWFPHNFTRCYNTRNGNSYIQVTDLPAFFKQRPSLEESPSYLYGWLAGYFAADGDVTVAGAVSLNSASYEDLLFVRDVCTRIGIGTFGVSRYQRRGIGGVESSIFRLRFIPNDLTEDFFLISDHRSRWESVSLAYERRGWTVVDVQTTSRVEEVFCAVVPESHSFTLADNILTGNCHLCGERGALNKLRKHFGDPIPREEQDDTSYTISRIWQEAAKYYHDLLADREDVLQWLKVHRGLSLETIVKHQLGWADGTLKKHLTTAGFELSDMQRTGLVDQRGRDFLFAHVSIPYIVNGNVVLIRGRSMDGGAGKYLTPPQQKTRLFNADATWNAKEVVITEGEFDALVLEQCGYAAVGVPGATAWQQPWSGYFQDAKKIFVCFDNDAPGQAGSEKVARALGPNARIIKMPENLPGEPKNDPTEWIVGKGHTKDDFQLLLVQSRGGHLLTVDDAFSEWADLQNVKGIQFGLDALDRKLEPGLLPSQVMVILAKTGAGKTIFLLNTFQRICLTQPKLKVLFVSLEQTRAEWFERARRIYRFYNLYATDQDCLDFYRDRLMLVDKNRLSEDELISCLEQYEYELGYKPDLVAIDYLGYWARSYKGEPYERTSAAVMALKAIAKEQRIAILAPHQVSRIAKFGEEPEADMSRDSGVVEETADFVLMLWAEDARKGRQAAERTGLVNLKVGKSRHGGVGTLVHLQFAPLSLAMIPQGDPLVQRAKDENYMDGVGDSFENAIKRHQTGEKNLYIRGIDNAF